jgi:hypothetical protein
MPSTNGSLAKDPGLLGERDRLAEGEHLHGQTKIGRDLHRDREPERADMGDRRPDGQEIAAHLLERRRIASDHEGELSRVERHGAARYRRVDEGGPARGDGFA